MGEAVGMDDLPYRPAAGIMLINAHGQVFVGQRIDSTLEAWQMPQGGLDPGEEPRDGALRELHEETGIPPDKVEVIACAPRTFDYDLPPDLVGKLWKGRYRGQRQTWFLCRYLGRDEEIDLATPEPEFRAWKWADLDQLAELIVPFKRQLYLDVVAEFAPAVRGLTA
jgi:putative (di)nucleoside polyphosphate hydrolase